jgi:hypothetical protein
MKKIKHYVVVTRRSCSDGKGARKIEEQINSLIEKGYQPYGDTKCVALGDETWVEYSQAMVLYED